MGLTTAASVRKKNHISNLQRLFCLKYKFKLKNVLKLLWWCKMQSFFFFTRSYCWFCLVGIYIYFLPRLSKQFVFCLKDYMAWNWFDITTQWVCNLHLSLLILQDTSWFKCDSDGSVAIDLRLMKALNCQTVRHGYITVVCHTVSHILTPSLAPAHSMCLKDYISVCWRYF